MNVTYRMVTIDDASALADVETAAMRRAYREFLPAAFLDALSDPGKVQAWKGHLESERQDHIIVAEHDGTVIGYVRADRAKPDESGIGFLSHFFILPEYWRIGVGTELMNRAVDAMRELSMDSAVLWVYRQNIRALGFYERLGWTWDGRTYMNRIDEVEYEMLHYHRLLSPRVNAV